MDIDEAAVSVQAMVRCWLARKRLKFEIAQVYEKYFDESTGFAYYVDKRDWSSSWEMPRLVRLVGALEYTNSYNVAKGYVQPYEDSLGLEESVVEFGWYDKSAPPIQETGHGFDFYDGYDYTQYEDLENEKVIETAYWETDAQQVELEKEEKNVIIEPQGKDCGALKSPLPAPFPSTNAAVHGAWRTVWPKAGNPHDAVLGRIDVYSCENPIRCMLCWENDPVHEHRPVDESWSLYQSFFAYNGPMPNSSRYLVFTAEKPFRCMVKLARVEDTEKKGDNIEIDGDPDGEWSFFTEFWAYYTPVPASIRYNVQEVVNPMRHRISFEPSRRGGWTFKFSFYAFPCTRVSVLRALDSEFEHTKLRIMPFEEHDLPHPPPEVETEGVSQRWYRQFEFFSFATAFPGSVKYNILRREHCDGYKVGMEESHSGWEVVESFYAFPIPVPHSTRYSVLVARNPTRYKVSMEEGFGKWSQIFCFYAYSSRREDWYFWNRNDFSDVGWNMERLKEA